jgi:hypothetical protein
MLGGDVLDVKKEIMFILRNIGKKADPELAYHHFSNSPVLSHLIS